MTDFWMIGPGKARRLQKAYMFTMGDVAAKTQYDLEWFYKTFGIDGEIMVDHAWGIEPVTMADIKAYHSDAHSLSNGQVLSRPYKFEEARTVLLEMIDVLCCDMFRKKVVAASYTWWVSFDYKSLEACPNYEGPVSIDFYGRLHPAHNNGTAKLPLVTNSPQLISEAIIRQFDAAIDRRLLIRRLGVCANNVVADDCGYQLDMFTDYRALEKEKKIQAAMLSVRTKYGPTPYSRESTWPRAPQRWNATVRSVGIEHRCAVRIGGERMQVGYMVMPAGFRYRDVALKGKPEIPAKHPSMDTGRRAKIFAPFAALKGFERLSPARKCCMRTGGE